MCDSWGRIRMRIGIILMPIGIRIRIGIYCTSTWKFGSGSASKRCRSTPVADMPEIEPACMPKRGDGREVLAIDPLKRQQNKQNKCVGIFHDTVRCLLYNNILESLATGKKNGKQDATHIENGTISLPASSNKAICLYCRVWREPGVERGGRGVTGLLHVLSA
jgi:hypothetical protein